MALALFDLDNTLLDGDSDFEWGEFLIRKKLVDAEEYAKENRYFYEEYENCSLDIVEYSAFSFKPLSVRSFEELSVLHEEFMHSTIIPMVGSKSKAILDYHRTQGSVDQELPAGVWGHSLIRNLVRCDIHPPSCELSSNLQPDTVADHDGASSVEFGRGKVQQ